MAKYLIVESRDPFDYKDVEANYELAQGLASEGNDVTLFLVQNGVLPARKSPAANALENLAKAGVTVLADEFSLRERAITSDRLTSAVSASPLDVVVDELADGTKTFWH